MASLYRKPVIATDPKTGQKVKTQSKKWWGQFKDANGKLRRHPLAVDKMAAQAMLHELVRQVEREKAGLIDPTDRERKRPFEQHLADFKAYLENKGVTSKQIKESVRHVEKMAASGRWRLIGDITASSALAYLGDLRRQGRSAQTYNHYLKSVKQFTRWLVRDRRTPTDALVHLSKLNVAADRRHDRRALSAPEFARLVEAAQAGKKIEGLTGTDRAMLYVLAAWTGFRKGELGSLTQQSLCLDQDTPTATVAACYSKRRRTDTQVLHADVVRLLHQWLQAKQQRRPSDLLFPISGRVPGGKDRKTFKMIARDLAAARQTWLDEAASPKERMEREQSDFLAHQNHAGLYADFHSLRHYFITSLERSGASPKMAQTLARHSDIRLTLGVYTHVELRDHSTVISNLPGPTALPAAAKPQSAGSIRAAG
jgi:site-specific recombinase XerD